MVCHSVLTRKMVNMIKSSLLILTVLLTGFMVPYNHYMPIGNAGAADGPYVLYKNKTVIAHYFFDNNGIITVKSDSVELAQKEKLVIHVSTDEPGKVFPVTLKQKLHIEKCEYKRVNKQLVISDIEGNFRAFRRLLQANGVMDAKFNWTFGEGHLVLNGDFFDRGNQVTEVLWLIYSLEEKAKVAGGYVHFILGNHEIMNMNGDLRYVQKKYIGNAYLLGERYVDLYGEDSELGRWLRTKNIVEKIGNMLYVHGGISAPMNKLKIPVTEINEVARPFYADSSFQYENRKQEVINGDDGPFWYRGYYQGNKMASREQIDSSLALYNTRHIATGHTVVADTVSTWYDGKIFNTDVRHASGFSEALLVENDKFFRVNTVGEKFLIRE